MKAIFTILFAFLISAISFGQIFEHHEDRGSSNTYSDIINVGDSIWVVTGNYNSIGSFFSGAYIEAFDVNGEQIWEYNTPQNVEERKFDKLKQMPNGNLAVFGTEQFCCDCTAAFLQMHTFSPDGELIGHHSFPGFEWPASMSVAASEEAFAVSFNVGSLENKLFAVSFDGDSLWTNDMGSTQIIHTKMLGEDFVAFSEDQLVRIDSDGVPIDTLIYVQSPVDVVELENDKLLISRQDGVYELQPDLSLVPAITYPEENAAQRMFRTENHIYLWYDETVYHYNLDFELDQTTVFAPLPYFEMNDVAANDNSFTVVGYKGFDEAGSGYNGSHRGAAMYNFSNEGQQIDHFPDLGLKHMEVEELSTWVVNEAFSVYQVSALISGYLYNAGDVTVNEANLSVYGFGICNLSGNRQELENMNLAPGDSMFVSLEAWSDQLPIPSGTDTIEYCMFVSEPSNYYDRNEMNDFGCASLHFVGVEEIAKGISSIYPNPAKERVTFEFSELINAEILQIYNLTGEVVEEINLNNRNQLEVNVIGWPVGIYLARTISEQKVSAPSKFTVVK